MTRKPSLHLVLSNSLTHAPRQETRRWMFAAVVMTLEVCVVAMVIWGAATLLVE